jgi:hypothetical protein
LEFPSSYSKETFKQEGQGNESLPPQKKLKAKLKCSDLLEVFKCSRMERDPDI